MSLLNNAGRTRFLRTIQNGVRRRFFLPRTDWLSTAFWIECAVAQGIVMSHKELQNCARNERAQDRFDYHERNR